MTLNIPVLLGLESLKNAVALVEGQHHNEMITGVAVVDNFADLGDKTGKLAFVPDADIPYINNCISRLKAAGACGLITVEPTGSTADACRKENLSLIALKKGSNQIKIVQEIGQAVIDTYIRRENYIRSCYNSFYKDEFSCDEEEIIENLARMLEKPVVAYYAGGRIGSTGCLDIDEDAMVVEREEGGKQFIQIGETVMEGVIIPFRVLDRVYGRLFVKSDTEITNDEWYLIKGAMTAITMATTREFAVTEIEHKMRNELLNDLITGNIQSEEGVLIRAKDLGWNISAPSLAVVCKLEMNEHKKRNDMLSLHHKLKSALSELMNEKYEKMENRIIGAVGDTVNIIWHIDTDKSYTENCEDIREVLTKLFEKSVEKYGIAGITGGIGSMIRNVYDIKKSFEDALCAIKYGHITGSGTHIYDVDGLGVYRLIGKIGNKEELLSFVPACLKKLVEYDSASKNNLVDTLDAYLSCEGNLMKTSQQLNIHYKTLTYRVNRAKELMEMDEIDGDIRLEIQLGIKILRMLKS